MEVQIPPTTRLREISIKSFLEARGFKFELRNNLYFCKSPFCRDTQWSFAYYPNTNSFYDWAMGFGGSIIDLVYRMENCTVFEAMQYLSKGEFDLYKPNYKVLKTNKNYYDFEPTRYTSVTWGQKYSIEAYAISRGWEGGYEYGVYYTKEFGEWVAHPAVMFVHRDENLKPCGAKFRKLPDDISIDKNNKGPRFTSRGKMGIFMLEYVDKDNFGPSTLYFVEGEGNAISLWQWCRDTHRNAIIASFGGVGQFLKRLPDKLNEIEDRKLIIDYDGNEELYQERLKSYEGYRLTPIKLILDKGVDINNLYTRNEMHLINHLL